MSTEPKLLEVDQGLPKLSTKVEKHTKENLIKHNKILGEKSKQFG